VSEVQAVVATARRLLADVTPDGALHRPDAPVLVVVGDRATVRREPDGAHSCKNLATVVRPAVADRATDRLGSAHA
jgi:hypothetical protein